MAATSSVHRQKRKVVNLEKLEIIRELRSGRSQCLISELYNRQWVTSEERVKIENYVSASE